MSALVVDTPGGIQMFGLLSMRGRLHIEIRSGMPFSSRGPTTMEALRRAGITMARRKWTALCDLNEHIAGLGGPADGRSYALQKWLASQGKFHDNSLSG